MVRRDPVGSRLSFADLRVRLPLLPLTNNMVSVVYMVRTPACEAGSTGSTPSDTLEKLIAVSYWRLARTSDTFTLSG